MEQPRHCLVTGAGRGMGLEFASQLLARGDHVVATARQPARAQALNRLAGEYPGRLHVLPLDITEPKSRAELARELPLVLGEERLGLLLNNAGVLHSGERFGKVDPKTLEHSLHVNTTGPFLLTQTLAPLLADGATVANLSSELGSIAGIETFRAPSYAISKAAQNMATALLGRALAERDITVLAFHPGWVRTEMGGEKAPVEPADAVGDMLATIDRADTALSGHFIDRHGEPMAW